MPTEAAPARPASWLHAARADRSPGFAVLRFVVAFGALAAPWPGLDTAFVDATGAIATAIADPLSASSNVTFELRSPRPEESQPAWRGVITVRQDLAEGSVNHAGAIDLRRAGYLQLATFLALAFAWPARGRRRAAIAAAVACGVVAVTIAVPVLAFLAPVGAIRLPGGLDLLVTLAARALVAAPGMAYAVPGLAWLAVSNARRDGTRPPRQT